jgi:polar amino acid transport system substrate-binding protein
VVGPTFLYGNGFGIAISKENRALLKDINNALVQYENSDEYKINYNKYLEL